jgi:hypothetical protein
MLYVQKEKVVGKGEFSKLCSLRTGRNLTFVRSFCKSFCKTKTSVSTKIFLFLISRSTLISATKDSVRMNALSYCPSDTIYDQQVGSLFNDYRGGPRGYSAYVKVKGFWSPRIFEWSNREGDASPLFAD